MDTGRFSRADTPSEPPMVLGLPNTSLTRALSDITRSELREPDLSVTCIEGTLAQSISFPSQGPAAFSLTLALEGKGRTRIDGIDPLEMMSGMGILFWSDDSVSGLDEIEGEMPIQAVEIRLHPEQLARLVGNVSTRLRSALLTDRSDPSSRTVLLGFPLSADLIEVAKEILECGIDFDELRRIYMRGKGLEALALAMDTLVHLPVKVLRLTPRDRTATAAAKRLIDTSPGEPWTIASLAAAVGLSESKLKIGFREIVGVSTRIYLRQTRIEEAAAMIARGDAVTEAALANGFQNLSHFSKAFRIVKGMGPREFALSQRRRVPR